MKRSTLHGWQAETDLVAALVDWRVVCLYRVRMRGVQRASHSFDPILILAGIVPFVGMILVLLLARNTEATEQGWVRRI